MKITLRAREDQEAVRFGRLRDAFTLLEVTVAVAVFFMVAFAILDLVTRSLVAARSLRQREPDPGIILSALSMSNALEETVMNGSFEDIAPGMYPDYRWEAEVVEVGTNGLFEIRVLVRNDRRESGDPAVITAQFFRPNSRSRPARRGLR